MKRSVLIAIILLFLVACRPQPGPPASLNMQEEPQLEKLVLLFAHSFTSPSILIWDIKSSDITFQNISSVYKIQNDESWVKNSIRDYNYRPLSLHCKIDPVISAYIRDSLKLELGDFDDNMPQIEDGMVTRIMSIYNDGTLLSVESNTPNENQATLCYFLLDIAVQNQPDSLSKEYLKYIQDYFERDAIKKYTFSNF